MKKLVVLLVVLAVAGLGAYWPARHHVVKTEKGVVVLSKRFLTYTDTFVDVRKWSSADFDAHPELKRAMIDQGYRDMLVELKTREVKATFNEVIDKAAVLADEIAAKIEKTVAVWLGETPDSGTGAKSPAATNQPSAAAPAP